MDKIEIGKLGENIAVKFLEKKGYEILERNYRKPWGEIDIIAKDAKENSELVFVEVKAQNEKFEWRPEENITLHKKRQLKKIIESYLEFNRSFENENWRIDVVAMTLNFETKNAQIEHIKNISLT